MSLSRKLIGRVLLCAGTGIATTWLYRDLLTSLLLDHRTFANRSLVGQAGIIIIGTAVVSLLTASLLVWSDSVPWRLIIFAAPVLFFAFMFWMEQYREGLFEVVTAWEGPVEQVEETFFALSAILLLVAAGRFVAQPRYMRWVVLLAGIGLLLVTGEEISWGQRIFHLALPQYFEAHNVQEELNVHNLPVFESWENDYHLLVGFIGASAWLVADILAKWTPRFRQLSTWIVPPWYMSLYFLPFGVTGIYFKVLVDPAFLGGLFAAWPHVLEVRRAYEYVEPGELLFAAGCLLIALHVLRLAGERSQSLER